MKKRIIALLMAAAITTGVGGFGTYAYFTSAAEVNSNVNIAMGTLDVNADWSDVQTTKWVAQSAGNEATATDDGANLDFTNVKPGDTFFRDVKVTNDGTLAADTAIILNDSFYGEGFEVDFHVSKDANGVDLVETTADGKRRVEVQAMEPGAYYNVRVEVMVKEGLGNEWQGTGGTFDANNFITVSAHQIVR